MYKAMRIPESMNAFVLQITPFKHCVPLGGSYVHAQRSSSPIQMCHCRWLDQAHFIRKFRFRIFIQNTPEFVTYRSGIVLLNILVTFAKI